MRSFNSFFACLGFKVSRFGFLGLGFGVWVFRVWVFFFGGVQGLDETKFGQHQVWPNMAKCSKTFWKVNQQKCQKMAGNKKNEKEGKQTISREEKQNAKWRVGPNVEKGGGAGGKGGMIFLCFCACPGVILDIREVSADPPSD